MNGREVNRSIKKSQNYCQYGFFRTLKKYTRTNKLATITSYDRVCILVYRGALERFTIYEV